MHDSATRLKYTTVVCSNVIALQKRTKNPRSVRTNVSSAHMMKYCLHSVSFFAHGLNWPLTLISVSGSAGGGGGSGGLVTLPVKLQIWNGIFMLKDSITCYMRASLITYKL